MTSSGLRFVQLLALAAAAAGFSAQTKLAYSPTSSSCRMSMHAPLTVTDDEHVDIPRKSSVSIRPALISTAVAASIFASSPMAAHATIYDNAHSKSADLISPVANSKRNNELQSTYSSAISSSSFQLSTSTMANPIGEMEDGSDAGIGKAFGQWFTLIYIVVSLLAGGKEMLKRAQKQLDKDS